MSETYRKTLKALELELAEAEAIVERLEAAVGAVRALVGREPLKAAPRAPRAPRKPQKGIPQGPRAAASLGRAERARSIDDYSGPEPTVNNEVV